ncbi:MAG TPA: M1 family aminopeptidase [Steroidobacteraceae bacterium]
MFREFLRFELRYQLRSPLPWLIALLFGFLAFLAMTGDNVQIGGAIGNVNRNAPSVILNFMVTFSILGMLAAILLIAQPLLRDADLRTDELFFSTPARKGSYLWGRALGGAVATLGIFVVVAVVMVIGSFMPWLDPKRVGPFAIEPYAWAFGVLVVPNLIFVGAVMCLLAVTTRRLLAVFLGAMALLVVWQIAGALVSDLQYDTIARLIDPFGARPTVRAMRYWSATERNTLVPDIGGLLLLNRIIWLSVSVALLAAAHFLFRTQRAGSRKRASRRAIDSVDIPLPQSAAAVHVPAVTSVSAAREFGGSAALRQFLHQLRFDAASVLKSLPFQILLGLGLVNLISSARLTNRLYGTEVHPVTALMMEAMQGSYQFLLVLIVAYFAGEVLWRERDARIAEATDATPVPGWVPLLAKLGALFAVIFAFMAVGALASMVFQLSMGYTSLEVGLYLRSMLLDSMPFLLTAVATVFLQVMSNQKFIGYALFILLFVLQTVLVSVHLEHNLYTYAGSPTLTYSDMNGYGHLLRAWGWFNAYWSVFAAMLLVISAAFWVRGSAPSWRGRLRQGLHALGGRRGALLGALAVVFVAIGSWIFYNTNVVNEYLPSDVVLDRQAHFEKAYRKYKDLPQPRIADIYADVDIYPAQRRVAIKGRYQLVNRTTAPIQDLHVTLRPGAELRITSMAPAELVTDDREVGYRIYRLQTPLAPGATMEFRFEVERAEHGFTNTGMPPSGGAGDIRSPLNYNGTFLNSTDFFPHFGYDQNGQILDRNERRKRGLGDVPRAAKLEDASARGSMGFPDADWINFETVVSTSADQIALAPGYLQREWTQDGRHYFHYKMDRPILPFFCYLSAHWQLRRGEWHGLPIEVYYDAKHPYDVDRMIEATRKSLDYFTANFSPYQFRQVRILEFPRYARFAQSFANTIPFSEAIGFVADLRDPDDIDYVFYVTAHEVAHQWWAHQVIGADVQGQTMLVESLAQYSALMVMEKEYGRERMRRFLKYELDQYLGGRGGELIEELPLMRVENQQYIHYRKGSVIFYRLREEIGEDKLDAALANFIRDKAFQQPPYTTTLELLDYIRAQTPPDKQRLIDELFAKIVLYDTQVVAAKSTRRADGKFDVHIEYETQKVQADGVGKETPLPLDDWMEVGVFARKAGQGEHTEKPLYLQRQHITQNKGTFDVVVDAEPFEVGVDPYNKLIDRNPDDNRKRVE